MKSADKGKKVYKGYYDKGRKLRYEGVKKISWNLMVENEEGVIVI